MAEQRKGPPILVYTERCTGCLTCQLRCSLRFEKAFNPSRARIEILRLVGAETEYAIAFALDCDNCGVCAHHCPYEALLQEDALGAA